MAGKRLPLPDAEIARRYTEGREPMDSIARSLGCSATTVRERLLEQGVQLRTRREAVPRGEQSPHWKGGRSNRDGYQRVRDDEGRRVDEHRLIIERESGRRLGEDEHVHHINHDRADNRSGNLMRVWPVGGLTPQAVHRRVEELWDWYCAQGHSAQPDAVLASVWAWFVAINTPTCRRCGQAIAGAA